MSRFVRTAVVLVLLVVIAVMAAPLVLRVYAYPRTYASLYEVPQTDAAVVLGASVVHGSPSPILAARADLAVQLYKMGKVQRILVTGDNRVRTYDEITPVHTYLLAQGIPEKDIVLDPAGYDTYTSMYRTLNAESIYSATIVTQDFHLPRALCIARSVGIDAYGIAAESGGSVYDYVREVPASVKALFDIATRRIPA